MSPRYFPGVAVFQEAEPMTYVEKLQAWYESECAAGRVVDVKLSVDGSDPEATAKAIYETIMGQRERGSIDTTGL